MVRIWSGVVGLFLFAPSMVQAGGDAAPLNVPFWTALPFGLLLGCIALLPLVREHWWHANRNKAIVALGLALPVIIYLWAVNEETKGASLHALGHELAEYASFIILLTALYAISGGILLIGDIPARPRTNTFFMGIGAVLANLIGTTGASMVLIRPLLRINLQRKHKIHLPIFFIFIVSNTGGLLTPLGDPPLFLGFLQGVGFFWTFQLWPQWLVVNGVLLGTFWIWDTLSYGKESAASLKHDAMVRHPLRLAGAWLNGSLLLGVLLVIIFHSEPVGQGFGAMLGLGDCTLHRPWGQILTILLMLISLALTPRSVRRGNEFVWGPIVEVAVLFLGIFITMVPALALLRQHGGRFNLSHPAEFFWLTGILSAFLDNAPTYLTFATLASGDNTLGWLSLQKPQLLAGISCGAVFMGAMTYIGNGPNFMVKAIAEKHHYHMPSFFGFLKYSCGILLPLMVIVHLIFFRFS